MENFGDALSNLPELAPGIIVGTIAGIVYGLRQDFKEGEVGNFWAAGGMGMFLGAIWSGRFTGGPLLAFARWSTTGEVVWLA